MKPKKQLTLVIKGGLKCPWCGLDTLRCTEERSLPLPAYNIYDCKACGARYRDKIKGD